MNGFIWGILFALLFVNFIYYPLVSLGEAAVAFITREPYKGTAEVWQSWKYDRDWLPDAPTPGEKFVRWLALDFGAAFVVLFVAAWWGSHGILWVPVVAVGLLFGLRAYVDRYGKEFKVKL